MEYTFSLDANEKKTNLDHFPKTYFNLFNFVSPLPTFSTSKMCQRPKKLPLEMIQLFFFVDNLEEVQALRICVRPVSKFASSAYIIRFM